MLVINLILAVAKITAGSQTPEPSFNIKTGSGARRSPRAWKLRGLYPPGVLVLTRDRGGEFRKLDVLTRTVLHPSPESLECWAVNCAGEKVFGSASVALVALGSERANGAS